MRLLLPLVLSLVIGCHAPRPSSSVTGRVITDEVARADAEAPEQTLREFFRAFLEQDELALRRLTLDCQDRAELWSFGEAITRPDRRREFLESRMRRVAPGEVVYLPFPKDVRPVLTDENLINDGRVVIVLDDNRFMPWLLVRTGGTWRVDPYPFVVAIKVGKGSTSEPLERDGHRV